MQIVGHSDTDNPDNFRASHVRLSASRYCTIACLADPGSLEITSRTLATVMCDAEDPCSVNTAYEPDVRTSFEQTFNTSPSVSSSSSRK